MSRANPSPGARLLANWQRLRPLPFGPRLFSWVVGRTAPYTGSVGGVYTHVEPGYARVELADRRAVRNHLASIHAVALVNLAEMTSGVALMTALPPRVRGIVTGLSIEYRKKARGRLVCETRAPVPEAVIRGLTESLTHDVHATITPPPPGSSPAHPRAGMAVSRPSRPSSARRSPRALPYSAMAWCGDASISPTKKPSARGAQNGLNGTT